MAHHGNSNWQRCGPERIMGLRSLAWDRADLLNNQKKFRGQSLQLTWSSQLPFFTSRRKNMQN